MVYTTLGSPFQSLERAEISLNEF